MPDVFLFSLFLFFLQYGVSESYKPVILMHGILSSQRDLNDLKAFIKKAHPGTETYNIDAFNDLLSLEPMGKQVRIVAPMMKKIMDANPQGVHLICFSQGGLVCRGVLETLPSHNVYNFISLSSPQGGQFGVPSMLKPFIPAVSREYLYEVFYTSVGQNVSVGDYWYDPHHLDLFKKPALKVFLAQLNNQTANPYSSAFKNNFLKIKNLIMIGGPDDGVITPWQSSHFGTYDENENVKEMVNQEYYIKDSFGLQTLNKRGSLHKYVIPGVKHTHWHGNKDVFEKCIEQWLD
ncbi:lysosomal thioesterase PPT2-B [Lingula anatina]|uniref:palmitoyl-CoA hydrolase n=1 Tax=Lingula anatina TaxID=7574 RepID=A0A1S3HRI9_LINAN|nr:lysosomal thioesterase PPT2-B [Lingula anatina]|eukprot:XP_013388652.1 lysosomal thioesterase PPT2-B [Lingula anatina]